MMQGRVPSEQSEKHGGRSLFWLFVTVTVLALMAIWLFVPWQWSPVDDPGQAKVMRQLFETQGLLGGITQRINQLALGDLDGGVFRPMAWGSTRP
jgi:hypothetical protein